jgi:quercetin dioxygenase-like cupin family protein
MALHHAASGEIVDLYAASGESRATALVKAGAFEAIRLALSSGEAWSPHTVPGEITLQCLRGAVRISMAERDVELRAGEWIYLAGGAAHALQATEDSLLLLTILLANAR